jgi:hypothetical protein
VPGPIVRAGIIIRSWSSHAITKTMQDSAFAIENN